MIIEWLKANWRYLASGLVGLLIGIGLCKLNPQKVEAKVEAKQAQSGTIETASHITIKPKEPVQSAPGCPPCPQLPEITVDCGGKVAGSQGQAISATASASPMPLFSAWIGLGAIETTPYASAMLVYGRWALTGQYGANQVYGGDIKFKALEF